MLSALLPEPVVVVETQDTVDPGGLYPAEAACIEKAVAKRRSEFATGRRCARRALAALGIENFPLLPDADRVPLWPEGIVGSISHAAGYVAVAVTRREVFAGLGVDVERADRLKPDLVARICRPDEILRLEGLPSAEKADWYKLVFSAKESVYKAYYPLARTFLGFQDVDIVIDAQAGSFTATLVRPDAPDAAGTRDFRGRYAFSAEHVFTAVVLATRGSQIGQSV